MQACTLSAAASRRGAARLRHGNARQTCGRCKCLCGNSSGSPPGQRAGGDPCQLGHSAAPAARSRCGFGASRWTACGQTRACGCPPAGHASIKRCMKASRRPCRGPCVHETGPCNHAVRKTQHLARTHTHKTAANERALTQFHAAPLTTARAVRRLAQTRLTASPLCAATVSLGTASREGTCEAELAQRQAKSARTASIAHTSYG